MIKILKWYVRHKLNKICNGINLKKSNGKNM